MSPDLRFYLRRAPIAAQEACRRAGVEPPPASGELCVTHAADALAGELAGAVVFADTRSIAEAAVAAGASLVFLRRADAPAAVGQALLAYTDYPRVAFARVARLLHAQIHHEGDDARHPDARIDPSARLAPGVIVGQGADIGAGVCIGPNAVIGPGVVIEAGGEVGAGASIHCALIGPRCYVKAGARIGEPGFGHAPGEDGLAPVPQLGRVVLAEDVEIGANAAVDRGALGDTTIGAGTKIDNLVQIGHNAAIGRCCVIAGQAGISGSCRIGDFAMIGGQAGIVDHLTIGAHAQVAANSGLMRDVPPGERWGGTPARPVKSWLREVATLAKLARNKR